MTADAAEPLAAPSAPAAPTAPAARKKHVTYIFPIYNEAGNIDLLHRTVSQVT
ncbi:MAG: hypothetical protein HOY78_15595, partial [Saccharothrix sp.]|nr:hypothetical protein [Saccharothrix sp.]